MLKEFDKSIKQHDEQSTLYEQQLEVAWERSIMLFCFKFTIYNL